MGSENRNFARSNGRYNSFGQRALSDGIVVGSPPGAKGRRNGAAADSSRRTQPPTFLFRPKGAPYRSPGQRLAAERQRSGNANDNIPQFSRGSRLSLNAFAARTGRKKERGQAVAPRNTCPPPSREQTNLHVNQNIVIIGLVAVPAQAAVQSVLEKGVASFPVPA